MPAPRSQNGSNAPIRPLRILSRPQQPQISGEPPVANSLTKPSNAASQPSKEKNTSSPNLSESVSVAKPQAPRTPVAGRQNQHESRTGGKETVISPSRALIPYTPPLAPPAFIIKKQAVVEEPILRLSIRELLDTSDILETRDLPKLPRLPVAPPAPMMGAEPNDGSAFMSPLTITGTPINPQGHTNNYEPTPVERFLKISDLTTRFLTERLTDLAYDPELSLRLQADFEVFEAAYHALPFERALNPYKVIFASVTALKKSVELRNNDAKIIGGLKEMTMAYDQIRSEALHGRWLRGEQPFPGKAAVAKLGQCGVDLVDSVGWSLRGGDQHCKLPPKVTSAVAPTPGCRTTGKFAKFFATPGVLGGLRKEMGM
ncbi:hypothetical protein H072_8278 [Dactylellina haptotyla CBS 200.50]|uniref:Uncharacterized protein n=1 Tax=Dactylellina haptotyla (strain CBS 200.50) TaxID=1284197 RepID=S8A4S5_DACHA|nr:hypothetical protein H072_8278 [Dactylellina haptotyla CBS 200.50]